MAPTKSSPKKARAASPRKTRQSPRTTSQASAGVAKSPKKPPTKASPSSATAEESPARGRGRPKKADSPAKPSAKKAASPAKAPAKRGRPPKSTTAYKDTSDDESESSLEEQPKTRRSPSKPGPKRKTKATEEDILPTTESHSPVRKSRAKSPAKSPTKASKVTKRSPSKSPAKTARKSPTKTAARSPSKSPAKTTRRTPQGPDEQRFEYNTGDSDIVMGDADEIVPEHPRRAAAAGYKTSSPGKSRQSPSSKAANWKARSPGPKGLTKAVARITKGKGKAAPKVPAPKTAERGNVESPTNPKTLPDKTENPFHKTLPAPEVWHRRMAPYFTFGETPYMEKVLSNEINRDLFKDQVSDAKTKGKASSSGSMMGSLKSFAQKPWAKKAEDEEVRYPYAWKVPSKNMIRHHAIEEAKRAYFPIGSTASRSPKRRH